MASTDPSSTEPLRGHGWKKKLGIISFPRNHFVITKYVISLERNDFEGTKYENMSFRGNEITLIFFHRCPLRGSVIQRLLKANIDHRENTTVERFRDRRPCKAHALPHRYSCIRRSSDSIIRCNDVWCMIHLELYIGQCTHNINAN